DSMSKGRILIVDDKQENLYLLKTLLEADGYETVTAPNGEVALSLARQGLPVLVISDILMPVLDGFTLCREWKKDEALKKIPFVFYTATYTDERDRKFALGLGADEFIIKPQEPDFFRQAVEEVLKRVSSAPVHAPAEAREEAVYQQYNQALVRKLEGKMEQLAKAVRELETEKAELLKAQKERENLQTQLFQAQKMEAIGRLAGGVAHDFNNMLSVIMSYTDMILRRLDPSDPLSHDLQKVMGAAQRSAELTRQLLAFARKETSLPKVLDLNEAVEALVPFLKRLLGENIELTWRPGEGIGPVLVGPTHLDQILTNLCVNSRDAIEGAGKIVIETGATAFDPAYCAKHAGFYPGEYWRLSVTDNGKGMGKDILAKIFEPFFTTKEAGKGTGLGLSTVYGIVQQNQGFITVKSELRQGAAFDIYLPRHVARPAVEVPGGTSVPRPRNQTTILLVEDELSILRVTTLILEDLGYNVVSASTPLDALKLAQAQPGGIHLLLSDVVMPQMSGLELAHKMLEQFPRLKRLYMSGYGAGSLSEPDKMDEGAHFIRKPFNIKQLAEKVQEALR
ncbi:MAG TPA: response regulator, partial [bacterium]|nr:response regulator [bacterium]